MAMLGAGTFIYVMARALPRVGERVMPGTAAQFMDAWIGKIPFAKVDAFLSGLLEKALRKIKVYVLKVDNKVSAHLNTFKPSRKAAKPGIFEVSRRSGDIKES